ncbi:hypothetical protein K437DRAFT_275627 [Tilletiaria anomala UBC 951]|uniref:Zinc finger CHCC-type domain-containing protein n=1 Tax=Tilletiaria anomala (strain ATCC 24038 / CBS 436.72 / UBC 951) TaxID=1037660 RepID=A0A066VH28_TILAU|nr:uncharacterized protein K437DRAFT_275627 [Tilletiaria anomala UBC 951]KDN40781.1 hypothetical protein K437DRAFT_275627 [Tilletiaria anomala UBC 951]
MIASSLSACLGLATASRSAPAVRALSTTSSALRPSGDVLRPRTAPSNAGLPASVARDRRPAVAEPHTPPTVPEEQAPNYRSTWSVGQSPRENAMRGPRFEQTKMEFQPQPLSAMEMIQREPIRLVTSRVASCDGGKGPLGHPKVFINLDKPGAKSCSYCGIRFELDHSHAGHGH